MEHEIRDHRLDVCDEDEDKMDAHVKESSWDLEQGQVQMMSKRYVTGRCRW